MVYNVLAPLSMIIAYLLHISSKTQTKYIISLKTPVIAMWQRV